MARDLITVGKDGRTAICEQFQLAAMRAKGWEVLPPSRSPGAGGAAVDAVSALEGLIPVFKGDRVGHVDQKGLPRALADGWATEPPEGAGDSEGLADLLGALDPGDDQIWNADGSLKMGAFNEAFGRKETRATVDAAWPGFGRSALQDDGTE